MKITQKQSDAQDERTHSKDHPHPQYTY